MANIANINGQTIAAAGGAFDPVAETGTYTETVPTSGMILFGGHSFFKGSPNSNDSAPTYPFGQSVVMNLSSDVDGQLARSAQTLPAGVTFTKISWGRYAAFGITSDGKMYDIGSSSSYMENTSSTTWTQITGIGDSDTGWTEVSSSYDGACAINSGKLYHVGANSYGQGCTSGTSYGTFALANSPASSWTKVERGRYSTVLLNAVGQVYTCGRNYKYQTGLGTSSGNTTTPTIIKSAASTNLDTTTSGVGVGTSISTGYQRMGIVAGSKYYYWGDGDYNEPFGADGSSDIQYATQGGAIANGGSPVAQWDKICQGNQQSYMIDIHGKLWFAGEAGGGQRGDGSTTDVKGGYWVKVSDDTDWTRIVICGANYQSTVYQYVAEKGGKLYAVGYMRYGNVVPATSASYTSTWAAVHGTNSLATAGAWAGALINAVTTRAAVIANYG
ncbi:MAG: hypothetical protein P8N43_08760 [Alphaproteobacteria bacterium]|nr:hypothetical protein [Alphaproteobacteria bacterium]